MFLALIAFAAGVVIGAYSHKWLAAEVSKDTGLNVLDPVGVAKQAEAKALDEVKKL